MKKQKQNKDEDPPLTLVDPDKVMIIFSTIVAITFIAFILLCGTAKIDPEYQFDNCQGMGKDALHITQSSILPQAPPYIIKGNSRAILVDIDKIIHCESNGDPLACNKEFGCQAGMGKCGFITSTWNETLDKMSCSGRHNIEKCVKSYMPERCWEKVLLPVSKERTEMIFDGECNRLAGKWLLENEGSQHWGTAKTNWGSYRCWSVMD